MSLFLKSNLSCGPLEYHQAYINEPLVVLNDCCFFQVHRIVEQTFNVQLSVGITTDSPDDEKRKNFHPLLKQQSWIIHLTS
jgi:hypothetical protein